MLRARAHPASHGALRLPFRISKTETFNPLLPILESPDILKTGVAIKDDVKELRAMEDFIPSGFVEIADITVKLGYENRGLRALAGLLLKGRISKAAQVSNWARPQLDNKQVRYAATDAWISREIYRQAMAEQDDRGLNASDYPADQLQKSHGRRNIGLALLEN